MRFRSLGILGAALALAGTAACTDNTSPNGSLTGGIYALTSVNGAGLPYSYTDQNSGTTTTLQSDVYTINTDGTYSETIQENVSNGFGTSPRTDNESGTWSQGGGVVTFQPTYSTFSAAPYYSYQASVANGGLLGNGALVFSNTSLGQMVYQHE